MERRLSKLEVLWQRRSTNSSGRYDLSALSQDEILELDDLLTEPARQQLRTGVTSYAMLSAEQMARLEHLWSHVREAS